jgi:hypothetical protein
MTPARAAYYASKKNKGSKLRKAKAKVSLLEHRVKRARQGTKLKAQLSKEKSKVGALNRRIRREKSGELRSTLNKARKKSMTKVGVLERRIKREKQAVQLRSMLSKARTKVGKIASKPTSTFLDYDKGSRRRMKNAFKKAGRM